MLDAPRAKGTYEASLFKRRPYIVPPTAFPLLFVQNEERMMCGTTFTQYLVLHWEPDPNGGCWGKEKGGEGEGQRKKAPHGECGLSFS